VGQLLSISGLDHHENRLSLEKGRARSFEPLSKHINWPALVALVSTSHPLGGILARRHRSAWAGLHCVCPLGDTAPRSGLAVKVSDTFTPDSQDPCLGFPQSQFTFTARRERSWSPIPFLQLPLLRPRSSPLSSTPANGVQQTYH
jgi:hypothetical protein